MVETKRQSDFVVGVTKEHTLVLKDKVSDTPVSKALVKAHARRELVEIEVLRAVGEAAKHQWSQRQIAVLLGRSQPDVQRTLKRIAAHPELVQVSPREIALRRAAGEISDEKMMEQMRGLPYSFGEVEPNPAGEGYRRGSWDEVRRLRREGLITNEEWETLFAHVKRPPRLLGRA